MPLQGVAADWEGCFLARVDGVGLGGGVQGWLLGLQSLGRCLAAVRNQEASLD